MRFPSFVTNAHERVVDFSIVVVSICYHDDSVQITAHGVKVKVGCANSQLTFVVVENMRMYAKVRKITVIFIN